MPASKKYALWVIVAFAVIFLGIILYFTLTPKDSQTFMHKKRPHIIVIIADDLGRNDVGFHGSNQIPTPNLDALAYNGIILDRHYTQYCCTPSRAAFLTGNYPIRSGMHGYPLKAGENRSIPTDTPTMPERLKKLGYKTHLVGKWHLGAAYRKNTPTGRGFDTHFGYWNGFVSYFDYLSYRKLPNGSMLQGFDLHDGFKSVWEGQGKYATELFTEKSIEVIEKHAVEEPLFLVVSHLAPHTGKNGNELEVPDATVTDAKYHYIEEPLRRNYADVVNLMDDSVGQIVKKLSEKNMLDNSIVLFFSDNGAQTVGLYQNSGSNWPLRGVKFTEFEGGVRVAAAIFSPLFKKRGYVNTDLIHLVDWLPTFYAIAGGDLHDLGKIDGINQWDTLSRNLRTNRSEILLNVNEVDNASAIISTLNNRVFKLLKGTYESGFYDEHYGESGRGPEIPLYNVSSILHSSSNQAIETATGSTTTKDTIEKLRHSTDLSWCRSTNTNVNCTEGCLFDLETDPCETTNEIKSNPDVAARLYRRLEEFAAELVPQTNREPDPASDPAFYNNTWCTWLDDELCVKTNKVSS